MSRYRSKPVRGMLEFLDRIARALPLLHSLFANIQDFVTTCRHWPVLVMGVSDLPSSIACGACALQPGSGFPLSLAEASAKGRAEEAYPVLVLGTQVTPSGPSCEGWLRKHIFMLHVSQESRQNLYTELLRPVTLETAAYSSSHALLRVPGIQVPCAVLSVDMTLPALTDSKMLYCLTAAHVFDTDVLLEQSHVVRKWQLPASC